MIRRAFLIFSLNIAPASAEVGIASVYWEPQRLSIGGRLDPRAWTCAHPKAGTQAMPFGTCLGIRNGKNFAECMVNDNGPHNGRLLDMTPAVAEQAGCPPRGLCTVDVRKVPCDH